MVETAHAPIQDFAAALAWAYPSAFLARLCEIIDAQPKPLVVMSTKARAEKLAALEVELLTLEFEDEAIVEASEIDGPVLVRRSDASCDTCCAARQASVGKASREARSPQGG
jgi:hypothetical protein